ncbi:hypothetical protein GCM10009714_13790 [Microlunatus capsulatus]
MTLPAWVLPTAAACSGVTPVEVTATISSCPTRSSGVSRCTRAAQRPAASSDGAGVAEGVAEDDAEAETDGEAGPEGLAGVDGRALAGPEAEPDVDGAGPVLVAGAGAAPRTPHAPRPSSSGPRARAVSPGRRRRRAGTVDDIADLTGQLFHQRRPVGGTRRRSPKVGPHLCRALDEPPERAGRWKDRPRCRASRA